jgi:uncharacterized protein (TIGR02996 family)
MSDIFQHPDYRALWLTVADNPGDRTPQAVLSDWLEESGLPAMNRLEADVVIPITWFDIWRFGIGSGSGSGSGIGSGIGSGRGSGIGIGSGRGSGIGIGRGSGIGIGSGIYGVHQLEIGKAYLFHCGDWHTFVGRLIRQVGPITYEIGASSKIHETNNGDCWDDLCAGNKELRRSCTYKHDKTPRFVLLSISASEWLGATPQEEGL